jgi:hypothetical protein
MLGAIGHMLLTFPRPGTMELRLVLSDVLTAPDHTGFSRQAMQADPDTGVAQVLMIYCASCAREASRGKFVPCDFRSRLQGRGFRHV